ncbi:hypothetical protein PHMEG_00014373 [Phytophthora megakarya]|uniref:MULE transposase domain-containing protein n=1 Tax=Phytophthora megakarya TaxID=4795 RepID=A0A225W4G7_9STRA|nr:hypothetical protein PHMEG_00014373 [Phytophthora megakarya]
MAPPIQDWSDFVLIVGTICHRQRDPRCTVRQRYNVFILGISDPCGRFFPVVDYCESQRRAEDVPWCLAYIKRVILRLVLNPFASQFIMTDADKAQHLNHNERVGDCGPDVLKIPSCIKNLIRQYFDNHRFSDWQSFYTPPGYPTTNHHIEQYHRTIKLENSSRASPFKMVKVLNQARVAFQAKIQKFSSIT